MTNFMQSTNLSTVSPKTQHYQHTPQRTPDSTGDIDPYAEGCTFLPQAEFFDAPYGTSNGTTR